MRADTRNWVAASEYDLGTAEHLLATGRYLYVVFICHLALEKLLKAIVAEATSEMPPRTHDLIYLVRRAKITPSQAHLDFLGKINAASVPTRYPEDLGKVLAAYPKGVAAEYLATTKEVFAWLKQDPRLQPS